MDLAERLTAEQELRLECARLAKGDATDARRLLDFVTGRAEQTPLETIADALREAGVR